ncbi:DNA-directed RNA polymerases I, II, and III subunit RPABC4 [Fonsecaea pedrosoi]|nr:DNA-directed RNA polymerases I, II, and III subunit RPABC4 [Fonsecaea pedrosoi]
MSSSQAYQIPSQSSGFATGYAAGEGSTGPTVQYVCGECNTKVSLGRGDVIRCSMCGHRVLYKERTKRLVLPPKNWPSTTRRCALGKK